MTSLDFFGDFPFSESFVFEQRVLFRVDICSVISYH